MFKLLRAGVLVRLLACALALTGIGAAAQNTTVIASALKMGGTPIVGGTVTITPTNAQGNAIPFVAGDGSQNGPQAFSAQITNGAIPMGFAVPDQSLASALTANTPLFYSVQVLNTQTKQSYVYVLPPNTVAGGTFALDQYRPMQVASTLAGSVTGTVLPNSLACNGGSRFILISGTTITAVYECVNGYLRAVPVGSGGGVAPTISIGTVTQGSAAASITGSNGAYTLNLSLPQGAPGANGAAVPSVATQTSSGTTALAFSNTADVVYDVTLSAATTFSFTAPSNTGTYRKLTLIIRPAGYQATLPASSSSLVWAGGSPPAVSTSNPTIITFTSTGNAPIFGGL